MLNPHHLIPQALSKLALSISVLLGLAGPGIQPTEAAERVSVQFGYLGRSISVSSLEAFARDGSTDPTLRAYLRRVSPETQEGIRRALTTSRELSASEIAQLLYTPTGETMLNYTGQLIQTASGQNGAKGIRGALILGASQPEGLSLLSFLQAFPTQEIRLDMGLAVAQFRRATRAIEQIDAFLETVKQQAQQDAATATLNLDTFPSFEEPGPYAVSSQTLVLEDPSRDRSYPADLYRPQSLAEIDGEIPVIVLSHGLGSSRSFFGDFAEHLASYGFVVTLPEHIGSNKEKQDRVRQWLDDELFSTDEFTDRPQDVSFLLDELERLNPTEFEGRLNLEKVGVIGHSFGGYTALALAGATIDFDRVRRLCSLDADVDVGLVLLLTCRSLELQQSSPASVQLLTEGRLQDERVAMVIVFNPVSNLFGESGMSRIQIPIVMAGGTDDFATPILREQAEPFTWLTTESKYLITVERLSHNAELTTLINNAFYSVDESDENVEMAREESRSAARAVLVAFAQVYLAGREEYRPLLSPAYLQQISEGGLPLYMVRSLPPGSIPSTLQ